jgi:HEAT repeat protein
VGHESRELQSTLASVLERFGVAAVPSLLDALEDERWQAREQAAYILGLIGSTDAVSGLIRTVHDQHWQVRFASAHALGELGGDRAALAVQSMQNDPDPRVRSLVERTRPPIAYP